MTRKIRVLVALVLLAGGWGTTGCGGSDDNNKDAVIALDTGGTDSVVAADSTTPPDVNPLADTIGGDTTGTADAPSGDTTGTADAPNGDASAKPFTVAESSVPREANPSSANLDKLVSDNNVFAFKLYGELRSVPGNLFYSPYSVSVALAMLYAGAKGDTATEIAKALEFKLNGEALDTALNALSLALAKRGEGKQGADGGKFRLNVVNQLWGRTDYTFLPAYLDTLAKHYGAGMKL